MEILLYISAIIAALSLLLIAIFVSSNTEKR